MAWLTVPDLRISIWKCLELLSYDMQVFEIVNLCPAEPGYTLPLQTV